MLQYVFLNGYADKVAEHKILYVDNSNSNDNSKNIGHDVDSYMYYIFGLLADVCQCILCHMVIFVIFCFELGLFLLFIRRWCFIVLYSKLSFCVCYATQKYTVRSSKSAELFFRRLEFHMVPLLLFGLFRHSFNKKSRKKIIYYFVYNSLNVCKIYTVYCMIHR